MARLDMPPGARGFHSAKLRISIPTAVPPHIRHRLREITSLEVPVADRRQGLASALLQRVAAEADESGLALLVHVKPYDAEGITDVEKLKAFYAKFGFELLQSVPAVLMIRNAIRPNRIIQAAVRSELH